MNRPLILVVYCKTIRYTPDVLILISTMPKLMFVLDTEPTKVGGVERFVAKLLKP